MTFNNYPTIIDCWVCWAYCVSGAQPVTHNWKLSFGSKVDWEISKTLRLFAFVACFCHKSFVTRQTGWEALIFKNQRSCQFNDLTIFTSKLLFRETFMLFLALCIMLSSCSMADIINDFQTLIWLTITKAHKKRVGKMKI